MEIDWTAVAKGKLRNYSVKKVSAVNLAEEIRELEHSRRSIRSAASDGSPVAGGTNKRDDRILNSMVLEDEYKESLHLVSRWLRRVERGLAILSEEEYLLLDRFYIHHEKGAADRLAMDLGIDVKTVYWRTSQALEKFTSAMCGRIKD